MRGFGRNGRAPGLGLVNKTRRSGSTRPAAASRSPSIPALDSDRAPVTRSRERSSAQAHCSSIAAVVRVSRDALITAVENLNFPTGRLDPELNGRGCSTSCMHSTRMASNFPSEKPYAVADEAKQLAGEMLQNIHKRIRTGMPTFCGACQHHFMAGLPAAGAGTGACDALRSRGQWIYRRMRETFGIAD